MRPKVVATGRRLTLTEATIFDAERTLEEIDQEASKNLKRFSEGVVTLADQRQYLNRMWNSKSDKLYLIDFKPPQDIPVGSVGLHEIDWSNLSARLGIMIFCKGNRGLGYGKEALALVHGLAFGELGLNRLQVNIVVGNDINLHRFLKLGYRVEGKSRDAYLRNGKFYDMLVLSLLKSEWQA